MITEEEDVVVNLLAEAWEKFLGLEVLHNSDLREFEQAIHVAQNIIMARSVLRDHHSMRLLRSVKNAS